MPLKKIVFKSGVNRENTRYTTEGGWYECDKIRFRQGTPEKIGGWYQISTSTFLGICRSLWNWVTLGSLNLLSVGTNLKFYIESGGFYSDITPNKYTSTTTTLTGAFTTFIGVKTVSVAWTGSNLNTGDVVNITGSSSAVGGVPASDFNGQFTVTKIDANNFQITVNTAASSSTTGGSAVTVNLFRYVVSLTNPFQCFIGSTLIRVTATLHGLITNNYVNFTTTSTFNGVTINGFYQINVIDVNTFTINASTTASANASSQGGAVLVKYQINTGPSISIPVSGWGSGTWSSGTWGTSSTATQDLRLWSQSNFGENLLYAPRGGAIYYWIAANNVTTIGYDIATIYGSTDVPIVQNCIAVSDASRFVFAFGCNDYGVTTQDPMLIRWSDQESVSNWTPAATNQAGSLRLSHGSLIVTSMQVRQEILVWTDSTIYSLQYVGPPAVWGSNLLGDNISIVGQNATVLASGIVYWMGRDKFYKYDGSISTLICDLRQYIYGNINLSQASQFFATSNEGFNEVWFFYCSELSTTIDSYVIYNYVEQIWYYGSMGRTAWLDTGLRNYPLAATYSNNIVYQEYGVDDGETIPATAINSYILSSEFDIDDGHNFAFIYRVLPDLNFNGSTSVAPNLTMTLYPMQNSGSGYNNPTSRGGVNYGLITRTSVVTIEQFTGTIFTRVRGRQLAIKVENNNLGDQWQLGAPRIDVRPDGRRGNT